VCTLFTGIILNPQATGQIRSRVEVSGQVLDASTDLPLPGVHVFLTGTTLGTVSDLEGRFNITRIPPGSYGVVASMVGYHRQMKQQLLAAERTESIIFELQPQTLQLETVLVEGRRPRRWRWMVGQFKERFLGTTPNARKCEILNPEVLDLSYDRTDDRLSARTQLPLEIENDALGYRLTLELDTMDATSNRWEWRGVVYFEEMEPPDDKQAANWERRREETYIGSAAHFLSALIDDRLEDNGFRAVPVAHPWHGWETEQDPEVLDGLIQQGPNAYVYELRGPVVLWIVYGDTEGIDTGPAAYFARRRKLVTDRLRGRFAAPDPRVTIGSWLNITHARVQVDPAGWMFQREGLIRYGEWAHSRFADELPRDYRAATTSPS
jgi:hypothetical protein